MWASCGQQTEAIRNAIEHRELTSTRVRQAGLLILAIAALLSVTGGLVQWEVKVSALLCALFTTSTVGLAMLAYCATIWAREMLRDPQWFLQTHRFCAVPSREPRPKLLDDLDAWLIAAFLASLACGPIVYVVGMWVVAAYLPGGPGLAGAVIRNLRDASPTDAIALIGLVGACVALLEGFAWSQWGRPTIARKTGLTCRQVMRERGFRWVTVLGWRPAVATAAPTQTNELGPSVSGPYHNPQSGTARAPLAPSSGTASSALHCAATAREREVSRHWRGALLWGLIGTWLGCALALTSGPVHALWVLTYLFFVTVPLEMALISSFHRGTVRQIVDAPATYCATHPASTWGRRPGLWAVDNIHYAAHSALRAALLACCLVWLAWSPGDMSMSAYWGAWACYIFWALSLQGLLDRAFWCCRGRHELHLRSGIDSTDIMKRAGYDWTWYWGWVRGEREQSSR